MKQIAAILGMLLLAGCAGGFGNRNTISPPTAVAPPPGVAPARGQVATPAQRRKPDAAEETADKEPRQSAVAAAPARPTVRWTSYKQVAFERDQSDLKPSDAGAVAEIAAYMARNPSLRLGIDGSDTRDPALGSRRVAALRDALIKAGVSAARIETGAFAGSRLKRDRGVDVLLSNR